MDDWLNNINVDELQYIAPPLSVLSSGSEKDTEQAASFIYKDGTSSPMASSRPVLSNKSAKPRIDSRPPKTYWEAVKQEIAILICTNKSKYKKLRKSLNEARDKGTKALVAIIAAGIGSQFGLTPGAIAGFCAIALNSVLKIGKEAYCNRQNSKHITMHSSGLR